MAEITLMILYFMGLVLLGSLLVVAVIAAMVGLVLVLPPVLGVACGRGIKRLFLGYRWCYVGDLTSAHLELLPTAPPKGPVALRKLSEQWQNFQQRWQPSLEGWSEAQTKMQTLQNELQTLQGELQALKRDVQQLRVESQVQDGLETLRKQVADLRRDMQQLTTQQEDGREPQPEARAGTVLAEGAGEQSDDELYRQAEKELYESYQTLALNPNAKVNFALLYREGHSRLPALSKKVFQAVLKELARRDVLELHPVASPKEVGDMELPIQTTSGWLYFVSWKRSL